MARQPFSSSMSDVMDPYGAFRSTRSRPTAYYFLRSVLVAGALAGGLVALYRNDVFLELARRSGQEHRYLEFEKFFLGTPGWGTPRSMQPELIGAAQAAPTSAPASAPVEASPAANPTDPLAPVSLESLPLLGAPRRSAPAAAPVSIASPPAPASRSSSSTAGSKARALAVSLDEPEPAAPARAKPKPEPAPTPAPPPAPVAAKPEPKGPKTTDARPNDNPLLGAIRGAVRARPPKDTVPQ